MNFALDTLVPHIASGCFIAPNASLIGRVEVQEGASIWFGAIARGDVGFIRIGRRTNIQDLCTLHVDEGFDLVIGDEVTVGHRAILHGCWIGDRVLIGMGAIVMNGARIGSDSLVGAGALVTEGMEIPERSLVLGMPATVRRPLTDEEVAGILKSAAHYAEGAQVYRTHLRDSEFGTRHSEER
jgi:carbonic anhydrase/acetyltransferase-like protein (isoleucine patch superfamily)